MNLTFKEIESFYLDALESLGVSRTEVARLGETDLACACPICGDSTRGNKRRLHLYQKGEVINVNCFNGDCPAKNLTPFKFMKTYTPRVFTKLRDFSKSRFVQQLAPKPKEPKELESLTLDNLDDWVVEESKTNPKLLNFIENFQPSEPTNYLEDLTLLTTFLSSNPEIVPEFKELLKSY